jgi:hypothetical protein
MESLNNYVQHYFTEEQISLLTLYGFGYLLYNCYRCISKIDIKHCLQYMPTYVVFSDTESEEFSESESESESEPEPETESEPSEEESEEEEEGSEQGACERFEIIEQQGGEPVRCSQLRKRRRQM